MTPTQQSQMLIMVDRDKCGICGCCVPVCHTQAIILHDAFLEVDNDLCTSCEKCLVVCPTHALYEVAAESVIVLDGVQ
jgi:MinD superfamily P-loop ATPase